MINIPNVLDVFKELLEFTNLELESCPWIAELTFTEIMKELQSEVKEIEEARTPEEISSELGDLFRDILLAMIIAHRDLNTVSLEEILLLILNKIKRRKPWILEGKKVSMKEAVQIWENAKKKEKVGSS